MRRCVLVLVLLLVALTGCSSSQPIALREETDSESCCCCCCCDADNDDNCGDYGSNDPDSSPPPPGSDPSLPSATGLRLIPQETDLWCWAATGEMLMDRLGMSVPQCEQADIPTSLTDCCEGDPYSCYGAGWLAVRSYGFASTSTVSALSTTKVEEELRAERPFSFTWQWRPSAGASGSGSDAGGHVTVVAGSLTIGGELHVVLYDPWPVGSGAIYAIPYTDYADGTVEYTHWQTDYNIYYPTTASE